MKRLLLVGIGSPHGDDRVGWEIALGVGERLGDAVAARCARTPSEMLDWLEGVDALEICDAFAADGEAGRVHCWRWPAREFARVPFRGSHDVSLPAVLALAERLGRLPPRVRIWAVGIEPPAALESLSTGALAAVEVVVERICGELAHA